MKAGVRAIARHPESKAMDLPSISGTLLVSFARISRIAANNRLIRVSSFRD
jgi:hypothetical protein